MSRVLLMLVLLAFEWHGLLAAEGVPPSAEAPRGADFQPYIFWAYGLACLLIFLFTLWTLSQLKQVGEKLEYLKERVRRAHPEVLGEERRTG